MRPPPNILRYGLPLLTKELIEQAARRRTYVIRVLYAVLLQCFGFLLAVETLQSFGMNPFGALGRGGMLFSKLTALQFTGVYLFMPALVCGVITQEKERDSLMLLLLTRLGPWTIVFEKLLSRLIPMATLLLLCLPLQALAYSLGGVSPQMLWGSQWMLLVTAIQMATLALACSCWFRTTAGAFMASYLIGLIMLFGPLVLFGITAMVFGDGMTSPSRTFLFQVLRDLGVVRTETQFLFPFFLAAQFFELVSGGGAGSSFQLFLSSLPTIGCSVVFFCLARLFLVPRAFVAPFNPLLEMFRGIDRGLERLNQNRFTAGRVLVRDDARFPETEPLAWRETAKRSLGRTRYLIRILLLMLLPIFFFLWLGLLNSFEACGIAAIILQPATWFLSILLTAVGAVSLIAGERSHQTLDVLSTLPLTGQEIVLQKFRGVRRLILILWVPLITLVLVEAILRMQPPLRHLYGSWNGRGPLIIPYVIAGVLSAVIYLPMIAWLCCLVGMVVRSQGRAIITALALIVGWCLFPFVVIILPLEIFLRGNVMNHFPMSWTPLLSPVTLPVLSEANEISQTFFHQYRWNGLNNSVPRDLTLETLLQLLVIGCNFAWYGLWWFGLRAACLMNADRLLGRMEVRQFAPPAPVHPHLPLEAGRRATQEPDPVRPEAGAALELTEFLEAD